LVADTPLPQGRYSNGADRDAFYRGVLERVRALPGVQSAGYTNYAPLVIEGGRSVTRPEGAPPPEPSAILRTLSSNRGVSSDYLQTLRVPLVSGRFFDGRDARDATPVAIVNETMAELFWPGQEPLGRRFRIGLGGNDTFFTIVGVVRDIRAVGLDVPAVAEAYLPLDQLEIPFMWPHQLVVRSSGDPLVLADSVRRAVWDIDPDQVVSSVRTMSEIVDAELANRATQLTLLGAFAAIALLLAAVGLYGTLSYTVSQSTNEIGLRMALGAGERAVVGAVVRDPLVAALVGVGLGLGAAFALTRLVASFLYGVSPTDPMTAVAVAFVLLLVAALAAFVPARRAASIEPMVALRAEG
jgi:putative ABC transport system permease protein